MSFAGLTHSPETRKRIGASRRRLTSRVPFNISLPPYLRDAMKEHPEINWSQVAEEAFRAKLTGKQE